MFVYFSAVDLPLVVFVVPPLEYGGSVMMASKVFGANDLMISKALPWIMFIIVGLPCFIWVNYTPVRPQQAYKNSCLSAAIKRVWIPWKGQQGRFPGPIEGGILEGNILRENGPSDTSSTIA